jgi:hypothetical protein
MYDTMTVLNVITNSLLTIIMIVAIATTAKKDK